MRTTWNSVFPEGFLPPPVPEASDRNVSDHFAGLWERIVISSIIKNDFAYGAYCPSFEKDITRRRCQDRNIYFTSMAAVQRHRRGRLPLNCVHIPKEVLDDVEEFDSDDGLMHGDNELCDTALVINIVDVLKNNPFQEIDVELEGV